MFFYSVQIQRNLVVKHERKRSWQFQWCCWIVTCKSLFFFLGRLRASAVLHFTLSSWVQNNEARFHKGVSKTRAQQQFFSHRKSQTNKNTQPPTNKLSAAVSSHIFQKPTFGKTHLNTTAWGPACPPGGPRVARGGGAAGRSGRWQDGAWLGLGTGGEAEVVKAGHLFLSWNLLKSWNLLEL